MPSDLAECIDNGPKQPKLGNFPPSRFGGQNRSFSASYYTKFPFVEYSVNRNAVFCFYCRLFCSFASEPTFTTEGFNHWKDLGDRLTKHAKSTAHVQYEKSGQDTSHGINPKKLESQMQCRLLVMLNPLSNRIFLR